MKKFNLKRVLVSLVVASSLILSFAPQAQAQEIENYSVFAAGEDNAHTYRIPALLTANDGSLIAIAEARWESWVDKTLTDVVVRRSTDCGKTWSEIKKITNVKSGAYMDPTPVIDRTTGEIFLFFSYWPENDHSTKTNQAFLSTSKDNGVTWSEPKEITKEIAPGDLRIGGFGPGIGIQLEGGRFAGRLLMPTRFVDLSKGDSRKGGFLATYYSDDHGKSWQMGEPLPSKTNEYQYAESPKGVVVANIRDAYKKWVTRSYDGGITFEVPTLDSGLPTVGHGCQSSIYGNGERMWYTGVTGRPEDSKNDNREKLELFMSKDAGHTWYKRMMLHEKAAAYSCISFLPDGRMAVLYEAADTPGFVRDAGPAERVHWMRMDIMILPSDVIAID